MLKRFVMPLVAFAFIFSAEAKETFLIHDLKKNNNIVERGDINHRESPCSTFKIPIALMGYEEAILQDSQTPELKFTKENAKDWEGTRAVCKQDHTPASWMKHSIVWYSQVVTRKMGLDTFKKYLSNFEYGNQDASGKDGLTQCWLSSTLQISAAEQVGFLNKLVNKNLSVSKETYEKTREILYMGELVDGWQLYGKTGSGRQKGDPSLLMGWFVGWIEKDNQVYTFACLIEDEEPIEKNGGFRAKQIAQDNLIEFVKSDISLFTFIFAMLTLK